MNLFWMRKIPSRNRRRGIALVIILSAIVLVSVVILAFFSRSILNRQIAFTSINMTKADLLARGALDLMVGELRREIADPEKSEPLDSGGVVIYRPRNPEDLMPSKMGVNGPDANGAATILKVSGNGIGAYAETDYVGSNVTIDTRSRNGRLISSDKWFGSGGPRLGAQDGMPTWMLLTRVNGIAVPPIAQAKVPTNDNYVIGRFAYTVYDISGLLDINLAGHPSAWTVSEIQQVKGTLAGADVSILGIDPDRLLAWRNAGSAAAYDSHVTGFSAENDFLKVPAGDNAFLNRRDLIRAAETSKAGLGDDDVLAHLTVFTREFASPSWGPSKPTGSSIEYENEAHSSASANRFIPHVRFPSAAVVTAYADDGSAFSYSVEAQEPLMERRFSLERLKWLGPGGPRNGGTAESIQACFGLVWTGSVWRYAGPVGSTAQSSIKTLAEVANGTPKREPNFFELLKAGILAGSLGTDSNMSLPHALLASPTFQIFRTGAAIIDQYDDDSYPTVIEYTHEGASWQACGMENLPYVNLTASQTGADPANPSAYNSTAAMAVYILCGLWNPHQTLAAASNVPNVRLRIEGGFRAYCNWAVGTGHPQYSYFPIPLDGYGYATTIDTTLLLANAAGKGARGFGSPGLLTSADVDGGASLAGPGPNAQGWALTPTAASSTSALAPNVSYVAYRMPDFFLSKNTAGAPSSGLGSSTYWGRVRTVFGAGAPFQVSLEYQNLSGAWIPYSFLHGNQDDVTWLQASSAQFKSHITAPPDSATVPPLANTYNQSTILLRCSDPRSVRFGLWTLPRDTTNERDALITPLWPSAAQSAAFSANGYGGASGTGPARGVPAIFGSFYFPAKLARNNTANISPNSSYVDYDNVRRVGDSGPFGSADAGGNPFQNANDRPVILNRPFQSVAELGYAFRDDPWKSLNFFSANSADAGLLDLFCLKNHRGTVVGGRVGLNSSDPLVLQALLKDTALGEAGGVLGKPAEMAQKMVSITATGTSPRPLLHRGELATVVGAGLGAGEFAGVDEEKIKPRREACIRALGDVGQARTWNLLVDVVAQTGRYPDSAASLDHFWVEGERRYWLHVAIDRFTGKIVDQQLELVSP